MWRFVANPERQKIAEEDGEAEEEKGGKPDLNVVFPSKRPRYLSERHYNFLKDHFSVRAQNTPSWLKVNVHQNS